MKYAILNCLQHLRELYAICYTSKWWSICGKPPRNQITNHMIGYVFIRYCCKLFILEWGTWPSNYLIAWSRTRNWLVRQSTVLGDVHFIHCHCMTIFSRRCRWISLLKTFLAPKDGAWLTNTIALVFLKWAIKSAKRGKSRKQVLCCKEGNTEVLFGIIELAYKLIYL